MGNTIIASGDNINGQDVVIVEPVGKTIREWFEELPEPYKGEALNPINNRDLNRVVNTLRTAIMWGIHWELPEHSIDWYRVYSRSVNPTGCLPETVPLKSSQPEPTQPDRIEAKLDEILALLKPKSIDPNLHTID